MGNNKSSQHHNTYPRGVPWGAHVGGPRGPRRAPTMERPHSVYERTYGAPGGVAYAEPMPPQMRRSMMSLNGDSGYGPSPSDSERIKRFSRLSLNEFPFDQPQPIIVTDQKTLKKIEKKHKKMLKKMGARMPPAVFHPMGTTMGTPMGTPMMSMGPMGPMGPNDMGRTHPAQFTRAMSYDDLRRHHEVEFGMPPTREMWTEREREREKITQMRGDTSLSSAPHRSIGRGSLESSSPMTSSTESHHTLDRWREQQRSRQSEHGEERRVPMQVIQTPSSPIYEGKPTFVTPQAKAVMERNSRLLQNTLDTKAPLRFRERVHNIERVERNEKRQSMVTTSTYAQPTNKSSTTTGYSSCRSSISGMPRGDQSEIDFSWVKDEEKKLNHNRTIDKGDSRLPECYFGLDPPKVEERERRDTREDREGKESRENAEEQFSPNHDLNVRRKAAYFEMEAENAEKQRQEREKELKVLRSRSNPHIPSSQSSDPPLSSLHSLSPLAVETQRNGPAERRLHRIQVAKEAQRELDALQRNRFYNATEYYRNQNQTDDKPKWRSSIAF